MNMFYYKNALWVACYALLLIFFTQESEAKIPYPDFDQSMLRWGLDLEKIDSNFEVKSRKEYENRNQELITFFRKLYYRNIKAAASDQSKVRIPRIVHQIWLGSPIPERFRKWMNTWISLEGWEYMLWTDEEVKQLSLYNRALYEKSTNYGEKSDIIRLELLAQFGGVYVDLDYECLKPEIFEELHRSFDFYIGFEPLEHGYTNKFNMFKVCNAIMAAAPGNSLIQSLIVNLKANYLAYFNCCMAVQRTGPSYLTRIICEYERMGCCNERNMYLPCTFFYPTSEPETSYLFRHPGMPAIIFPETAGFHYWYGTWWRDNEQMGSINKVERFPPYRNAIQ